MTCSSPIKDKILPWRVFPVDCFHSMDLIWLFGYQFRRYVEHLFHCEIFCILDGMPIVWVILLHEHRCLQCWRQKKNILHIIECSSLSFVLSFEDCFCLFRTWSFTLCKNDLDPNDNSDSVPSSSITNWCARCEQTTGLPVLSSIFFFQNEVSCSHERNVFEHTTGCSAVSKQRVSPFYRTSQRADSEEFDFRDWYSTKLSDAVEDSADGALSLLRAIRFILGLDFAVTRSSPDSCWIRFAIAAEQTVELKWLILNKLQQMIPLITCEISFVSMSASWFLVSMYLIWILESRLIRSNNQSRATLWVLETCLIVGLLPLISSWSLLHCPQNTYNKASWREDWTFEGTESMSSITSIFFWDLWRLWTSWSSFPDLSETRETFPKTEQLDPMSSREQANHLISVQCPKRWFQILLNCEKQQFVSCTSNLLEQMCDFRICTMFLQKWISNLQDLPRSRSLETVPICIVWQYYPHDNIVCIHMYDEYMKSIDSGVCHKLWSIS